MGDQLIQEHINNLDKYLRKHIYNYWCISNKLNYSYAIKTHDIDLFIFLHENGYPWNENTPSAAARNGQLDCLKYAHENGCPWDKQVITQSTQYNQLACLEYARANGCPK